MCAQPSTHFVVPAFLLSAALVPVATAQTPDPVRERATAATHGSLHDAFLRPPTPTSATARDLAQAPAAVGASMHAALEDLVFDEPVEGELWARGAGYKASFDASGVTIVPFFGASAPRNFPFALRGVEASLAGDGLV